MANLKFTQNPRNIVDNDINYYKNGDTWLHVINNLSEGLVLAEMNGNFIHWNKSALIMHGYESETDYYGNLSDFQSIFELYSLDGKKISFQQWPLNLLLAKKPVKNLEINVRHRQKLWSRIFNYTGGSFVDGDGNELFFITVEDITERKRNETALIESESRWIQLTESLPQLVWTCSPKGACDYLGKQWVEFTGIPEYKQLGYGWLNQIHPDDQKKTYEDWRAAVASQTEYRIEHRIRRHDGVYRWFDTLAREIYDSNRNPVKWFGSSIDIEDRKQAEFAVQKMNVALENRVEERTIQLEMAIKELESFSYSVSHDLRAPLRHVIGFANILQEDFEQKLGIEGQNLVNTIINSTEKMGQLIDDLLEFSRMGKKEMNQKVINMNRIVKEASDELLSLEPTRIIRLKISRLANVQADYQMIRQVWINLISNAFKYTRKNKISEIEINSDSLPDYVVFSIKDNGAGFNMDYKEKLFNVFQRLHNEDEFEGTGVGLALAKRIVNRHNGNIWAEGQPNVGATFYFTLPTKVRLNE